MRIKLTLCFVGLLVLTGSVNLLAQVPVNSNKQLELLFEQEWQSRIDSNPMLATRLGDYSANHLLPEASESFHLQNAAVKQQFLDKLKQIKFESLSDSDQVNYLIFKAQLERVISEVEFKSYQIPFLSDWGFHTEFNRLYLSVPFKSVKHYQDYIARLKALPRYFEQNIQNMNNGIERGFTMPKVVLNGFTDIIKSVYEMPIEKSEFFKPFAPVKLKMSKQESNALTAEAKKVIGEEVYPAYQKLKDYFDKIYIPKARESLGSYELPNGKNYYHSQIGFYTTLNLTADEIHQIGLKEVARIRAEMEEVIKAVGHKGSFKSFLKFLRESPQFYAKTPEELIKEASYIAKKMDGKLPKLFSHLPRQPYTVEPVPATIAPKYTTGRYSGAPLDSDRPGEYWVNTYALDKRPLYVLEALTLHEAVPGHHLQIALSKELKNLPKFRQGSYISAFGEGWGLYSERLGLEVGFYQDHYSNFGRLSYEMWRAARLVIDTGIHAKGWSRAQAIKLLEENSALSKHNIRTEVDRYISWPGQALAYKLGEIKILELRAKAEKALGARFDIRRFHDAILAEGSVPLNVLALQVDKFIAAELNYD